MTYARNPTYYIDVCCQKLKLLWNICSYSICGVFFRDFLTVVKGKTLWIFRLKGNQLIPNSNCWSPTVLVGALEHFFAFPRIGNNNPN